MSITARQIEGRLAAAVVIVALGWPSTAGAVGRGATGSSEASVEPEATTPTAAPASGQTDPSPTPGTTEPEATATGPDPEGSPQTPHAPEGEGGVEAMTPEDLAKQQQEIRVKLAVEHWQEGMNLYNKARYPEAAAEFERSYAAVPAASTLYSVALSYERAGKPVEAVTNYDRYLALPDCESLPEQERTISCTRKRADAEQAQAEQRRLVGELRLDLGEGVQLREVRVAGRTVPLDEFPVVLMPGAIDVELFGLEPDQHRSRVAYIVAGDSTPLYVAPFENDEEIVDPGGGDDGEAERAQARRRQRALRTSFWVGTGLTGASAVALATLGGLTLREQRLFDVGKCEVECILRMPNGEPVLDESGNTIPADTGYPLDHRTKFERMLPATNALIGVTIGLAVTTALVGAFAFRKRPGAADGGDATDGKARAQARRKGRSHPRAQVSMGAGSLTVRW